MSCTSTVPVVSAANEVLYCVGKRPRAIGRDVFTIEAVDWNTGESLYYTELGSDLLINGLYCGTIVGTKGDIVMGVLGGVIRLSESSESSASSAAALPASQKAEKLTTSEKYDLVVRQLDHFMDMNEKGVLPTQDELAAAGLLHI